MKLEFKYQAAYGKARYYPDNSLSKGLVELTGRKCLKPEELDRLKSYGFEIEIIGKPKEQEL